MNQTLSQIYYFNSDKRRADIMIKQQLTSMLSEYPLKNREIIILCIGSDRSTGDCLGPLVGHKLSRYKLPNIFVYGTLKEPVHAANLTEKIMYIKAHHHMPFIIAIDASLGTVEHVGYVTIGHGPLRPGLGVNKELPGVGDIHITGIVNFSGIMESMLLQTTRLFKVMNLADLITKGLLNCILEL